MLPKREPYWCEATPIVRIHSVKRRSVRRNARRCVLWTSDEDFWIHNRRHLRRSYARSGEDETCDGVLREFRRVRSLDGDGVRSYRAYRERTIRISWLEFSREANALNVDFCWSLSRQLLLQIVSRVCGKNNDVTS